MSIHFEKPMNQEALQAIQKLFGDQIAAIDNRNVLLDNFNQIHQKEMSSIARKAKQPLTLNLNGIGDVVEMSDETKYQVTKNGWRKINE